MRANSNTCLDMGLLAGLTPALIQKYAVRGPRYTSYPTAVEFNAAYTNSQWREDLALEEYGSSPSSAIYVHIPFCEKLCFFCACNKEVTQNKKLVQPYLEAIRKELANYAAIGKSLQIEQLHWGGGTPNYLSAVEMRVLFEEIRAAFPRLTADADISVELDPRGMTYEDLATLRGLGFNRISMGIQDFDLEVQRAINRKQTPDQARRLFTWARELKFESVGVDIVYGLACQTLSKFETTLKQVIALKPDRVALYGYAHVTWLKAGQRALEKQRLPTPEERIALFLAGLKAFTQAGYVYIGMDHFALPSDSLAQALNSGRLNRNFMGYSTHRGARIFAVGPSAISALNASMAQNEKDLRRYQERIVGEGFAVERGLRKSPQDRLRADLIERLMCDGFIDIAEFEKRWQINFVQVFSSALDHLKALEEDSLLEINNTRLALTALGRVFMRNVAMLFDQYLERHRSSASPVFSQAV